MEKRLGQKLGNLLGLTVLGFVLFLGFYHFSRQFASDLSVHRLDGKTDRPGSFHNEVLPPEKAGDRHVFHLNQSRSIGKANLVYRGLEGNSICLIDVIIPELDPQKAYTYKLDVETAEKGFRMAGKNFTLVAIDKHYIRLCRKNLR